MKYLLGFSAGALFASASEYIVLGEVKGDTFTVIKKSDKLLSYAPRYEVWFRSKLYDDFEHVHQIVCRDEIENTTGKTNIMCPERICCSEIEYEDHSKFDDGWCYVRPDTINMDSYISTTKQDRIDITEKILLKMTLGIYRLSIAAVYDTQNKDADDEKKYRPGLAHCDVNPTNILLINYEVLNEVLLTGYLGKQKLEKYNKYAARMDACDGSGDVNYFSPRRSALYMADKLIKYKQSNPDSNLIGPYYSSDSSSLNAITLEYKNSYKQKVALSTEDDLWSGLLSIYSFCYPDRTFEAYIEETGIEHECSDEFVKALGVNRSVCLKGLFNNRIQEDQTLPTYVYNDVNFNDYFNFDDKCTFPKSSDTVGYSDIEVDDSSDRLRDNLRKYLALLTEDVMPLRDLVGEYRKELFQQHNIIEDETNMYVHHYVTG
eukprot:GHVR01067288.1.p1 GENE.GHVR01067288.1~~GHVR01067288.1.p1  ORF type:complete len:432 (-),score=84.36 GHVR01067288.1:127-1422(-)